MFDVYMYVFCCVCIFIFYILIYIDILYFCIILNLHVIFYILHFITIFSEMYLTASLSLLK